MRDWLKELRENKEMTQQQVADLSEITQQYYNMIENGKRGDPLNVDVAKKIAEALNFDWTLFYDDDKDPADQRPAI